MIAVGVEDQIVITTLLFRQPVLVADATRGHMQGHIVIPKEEHLLDIRLLILLVVVVELLILIYGRHNSLYIVCLVFHYTNLPISDCPFHNLYIL